MRTGQSTGVRKQKRHSMGKGKNVFTDYVLVTSCLDVFRASYSHASTQQSNFLAGREDALKPSLASLFDAHLDACIFAFTSGGVRGLRAASMKWAALVDASPYVPIKVNISRLREGHPAGAKFSAFLCRWSGPMDVRYHV
jgi:hypothetical protein